MTYIEYIEYPYSPLKLKIFIGKLFEIGAMKRQTAGGPFYVCGLCSYRVVFDRSHIIQFDKNIYRHFSLRHSEMFTFLALRD